MEAEAVYGDLLAKLAPTAAQNSRPRRRVSFVRINPDFPQAPPPLEGSGGPDQEAAWAAGAVAVRGSALSALLAIDQAMAKLHSPP